MVSAAHFDAILWFVSLTGIAVFSLTLLMVFRIVWLRFSHNSRARREKKFLELWRPLMMSGISGSETGYPPLRMDDAEFFLDLWNHLHESVKGPAKSRLNNLAVRCGMAAHAHALLHRSGLRPRLMALITLGNLRENSAWSDILPLAKKPDTILSFTALGALLRINANAALGELKMQLVDRTDWPTAQLAILIQESGAMASTFELVDAALQLSGSTRPEDIRKLQRLLRIFVVVPTHLKLPAVRTILSSATDSELIAQCLKYLCEPEDLPCIRTYAEHPVWFVRLQAAHALGRIGATSDLPLLQKLLRDPVWDVRHRSADAIVALMRKDGKALAGLLATLTDPFARDMLTMSMAESRVAQ